ncbi:deoxynucleoside kinase [Limibacter armeniacum]|uniref:deoxynucleoside kinase n=1 Tax=Limibacter armeniacum TaxID=466084 RepID=UPI002FE58850
MYIAVAGNIGSGKTSLTNMLAQHFGWEPEFESADDNPYLKDFYDDMSRWAFHLQIYFLNSRFNQVKNVHLRERPVIQDRSIFEGTHIFAENLKNSNLMTDRDYQNYKALSDLMTRHVKAPNLLVYLKADTDKLVSQIQKRGRDFEQDIPTEYLTNLNELYEQWISQYDMGELLVIDMTEMDFVNRPEDFKLIADQVSAKLGL